MIPRLPRTSFSDRLSLQAIKNWLRGEIVDKPLPQSIPQLAEWFDKPCGRLLVASEMQVVNDMLPALFGYHLMQMSVSETVELAHDSPIHHRITVHTRTNFAQSPEKHCDGRVDSKDGDKRVHLVADFDQLPIESDSVDVVVLHHVLDFSPNPHQVLKEVNRILIPRGHVIIIGFNPFSLFGLWKMFASLFSKNSHWRYSSIAKRRLFDWFKLLDLEKSRITHTFFRPPFSSVILLNRFAFLERAGGKLGMPFGGVYVILARKDIAAVTPIRAPWEKANRRLIGLATARPSTPRSYRDQRKNKHELH